MVRKLFKHEFIAFGRIMAIVYAIILTMASATRIVLYFESDTVAYNILSSLCLIFYFISVFSAFIFCAALMLVRFYKNLFSAEGYLSFTLPVTATQHIMVKAVTAVAFMVLSVVTMIVSTWIVTAGDMMASIMTQLQPILDGFYDFMQMHTPLFFVEVIIFFVALLFAETLLYYTFIAIGQLFKKNRILASVGAYFVYYVLTQIVSTIVTVFFAIFSETNAFIDVVLWIIENPHATIHGCMWLGILLYSAFAVVEFFIIKKIITKKLNLE